MRATATSPERTKVRTGPPRTSDGRWADCITFHSTSRSVRLTGADLRAQVSESTSHEGAADRSIVFRYGILPIATAARVRAASSHMMCLSRAQLTGKSWARKSWLPTLNQGLFRYRSVYSSPLVFRALSCTRGPPQ